MTVITNITIITKCTTCTTYTTITVTAKGSPSRGAPAQRMRGGYFSHERHESHPSVTFGDSSPQREPFILPLMIHAVLFLVMGGAGQVQP